MPRYICLFSILISQLVLSQIPIDQQICHEVGKSGTCYEFKTDQTYVRTTYFMGCGLAGTSETGTYLVKSDSIYIEPKESRLKFISIDSTINKSTFKIQSSNSNYNNLNEFKIKIVDVNDLPLPGTIIRINDKNYLTDFDGELEIKSNSASYYIIEATFANWKPIKLKLEGNKNYNLKGIIFESYNDKEKRKFSYKIEKANRKKLILVHSDEFGNSIRRKFKI